MVVIMPWTLSALFTTGNDDISVFESNQIREPIPETPESVQKIHL
jgi:hypothetical protein